MQKLFEKYSLKSTQINIRQQLHDGYVLNSFFFQFVKNARFWERCEMRAVTVRFDKNGMNGNISYGLRIYNDRK